MRCDVHINKIPLGFQSPLGGQIRTGLIGLNLKLDIGNFICCAAVEINRHLLSHRAVAGGGRTQAVHQSWSSQMSSGCRDQ